MQKLSSFFALLLGLFLLLSTVFTQHPSEALKGFPYIGLVGPLIWGSALSAGAFMVFFSFRGGTILLCAGWGYTIISLLDGFSNNLITSQRNSKIIAQIQSGELQQEIGQVIAEPNWGGLFLQGASIMFASFALAMVLFSRRNGQT